MKDGGGEMGGWIGEAKDGTLMAHEEGGREDRMILLGLSHHIISTRKICQLNPILH